MTDVRIRRSNTILYCTNWRDTVDFYRDVIGLTPSFENDWLVEFQVHDGAHVSVADARRTSIEPCDGAGLTISWQVDDLHDACARLAAHRVDVSAPRRHLGALAVFAHDPAGNRIELWKAED